MKKIKKLILQITASTFLIYNIQAAPITIKIASQAPEGHAWGDALQRMGEEIEKATKKEVKIRLSLGGTAGDEPKVMRSIRAGLLHGAAITSMPLGELNGNIRALEIPFTFKNDRKKAYETLQKGKDYFNQGLEKSGYINLGFLELGLVYLISSKELTQYSDLKGMKIWIWSGDPLSSSIIKSLNLNGVPMGMEQVRQALSTKMVEAAYAPPLAIYALQWQSTIKTLVELPLAYSVGAVIVNKKTWSKLSAENQRIILSISEKHLNQANENTAKGNEKALEQLKKLGVNFINFSKEDIDLVTKTRESVITDLTGKLFDKKSVDIVNAGKVL